MRQPAGHRPGAHLGLGQKGQRLQGAKQRDVGPGHVIGDPQHRLRRQLAFDAHAKRQGAAQARQEPARQALAQGHQIMPHHAFTEADDAGQQGTEGDYQGQVQQAQGQAQSGHAGPVSYTHLDVYKRQGILRGISVSSFQP